MMGCALTATRPVQEMYNADAAIRAAKDLHADSLTPELFRSASEYHFKAKREYRLKNFEVARKLALRAMKLAEQAEFEAYRQGGATPEVAAQVSAPEGASQDHEEATRPDPNKFIEEPPVPVEPVLEEKTGEPSADKGTDYNEYLKQQEEKAAAAKKEEAAPSAPPTPAPGTTPPNGPTGPKVFFSPLLAQATTSNVQTGLLPNTGSLPPVLPGGSGVSSPEQPAPQIDTDRWRIQEESKTKPFSEIPSISDTSIPIMETSEMSEFGHNAQPEKEGLETLPEAPSSEINKEMPAWGEDNREDKK